MKILKPLMDVMNKHSTPSFREISVMVTESVSKNAEKRTPKIQANLKTSKKC